MADQGALSSPDSVPFRGSNPFVGPRAFEEQDLSYFYGREQEVRQLAALVIAQRVVLLYAPSGAGKTSLLQAGLIPLLHKQKRIDVLPIGRVSGDLVPGAADIGEVVVNIYVRNLLVKLGSQDNGLPGAVPGVTLNEGLSSRMAGAADDEQTLAHPHLLIIDQFEELFTTHPDRYTERAEFFRQLQECLMRYPQLSLLLSMREDYIAHLDYYAGQMPDRLRTRFRIEPLGPHNALDAIRRPAERAGIPFAEGVAEELVDNLRRVQQRYPEPIIQLAQPAPAVLAPASTGANGRTAFPGVASGLGAYVEPVHLQIICRQLWERLPQGCTEIRAEDVEQFGNVDQALTDFYERAVGMAMGRGLIGERTLRIWIDTHLITPTHTRGLVYRDDVSGTTEGLPNPLATTLNDAYIIRAEMRAGETWYELAHDRLVEPILAANSAWLSTHSSPVTQAYGAWLAEGRAPGKLLSGEALAAALVFAKDYPLDVAGEEREFLTLSERTDRQERANRIRLLAASGLISLLVLGLVAWGVWQSLETQRQTQQMEQQAAMAEANRLTNTANSLLNVDPQLSILSALLALHRADTASGEDALQAAVAGARLRSFLAGHTDVVEDIAYSANGRLLASASQDGTVRLWETVGGSGLYTITSPTGAWMQAVAFAPVGDQLAWGDKDGHLEVWDMAARRRLLRFGAVEDGATGEMVTAQSGGVRDLAYSPDGTLLASAGQDSRVRLWNATSGEMVMEMQCLREGVLAPCNTGEVWAVAFSPDGQQLAAGGLDGAAYVWDLASGAVIGELHGHQAGINGIAFSPDGKWLATAGRDNVAVLWDATTYELRDRLSGHVGWVRGVAFSPDSRHLATTSWDRSAKIWDVSTGRELLTLAGHYGWSTGVAYSPDGERLATGSQDGAVRIWDVAVGQALALMNVHPGGVRAITYRPDGKLLASVGGDGALRLWDVQSHGLVAEQTQSAGLSLNSAAFSPDSRRLVTAGDDRAAVIRDADTGAEILSLADHGSAVSAAVFSPDGSRVATASWDTKGRIFDAQSGKLLATLDGNSFALLDIAYSPDGSLLATAGGDNTVRLWDATSGKLLRVLEGQDAEVFAVAFNPNGKEIAGAGKDRSIMVWDVTSGAVLHRHENAHLDRIVDLAYSPAGDRLASAGWDVLARLWPPDVSEAERTMTGHTDRVVSVAFRPDGREIATASNDGSIVFVLLQQQDLVDLAQRRLVRPLSAAECAQYVELNVCPAH